MRCFITSCGRIDLLERTIRSLLLNQSYPLGEILVHEDSPNVTEAQVEHIHKIQSEFPIVRFAFTYGMGQHRSIEAFLRGCTDKFALMCEDDFEFENTYNWIDVSLRLLNYNRSAIKVLCRKDTPHPCKHDQYYYNTNYGFIQPWENQGIIWHGFSFNPGVTNLEKLRQFMPFPGYEQQLAEQIAEAEYKVIELEDKIYTHIGYDRSTHE